MSKLRSSLPCEFTPIAHGTNSIQVGEGGEKKKRKKKKKKPWLPLSHYMVNLQRMRRRHASQQKAPDLWKAAIYMHMVSVS